MTSPVDTTVKYFSSQMPGAPVLTANPGQLIALLDACLVNGFGALTLTSLTVAGGIATAAYSGAFPATPETVVLIGGVTGALTALNGEQKVTAIGTGTFSFATAAANGAASGTVTAKMAPAGWVKPFTGTNLAAYRTAEATGNRFFLRVNDANALDARVNGYETMTAISTGANLFPTAAQISGGGYWAKGMVANDGPIPWFVIANGKRFWYGAAIGATPNYGTSTYDAMTMKGFGEFTSLKSTVDAYNTHLMSANTVTAYYPSASLMGQDLATAQMVVARLHTNAAGAQFAGLFQSPMTSASSGTGGANGWGPLNGVWAKLALSQLRIAIQPTVYGLRGIFKEVWHTPQQIPPSTLNMNWGDFVIGVDQAAGRKLIVLPVSHTGGPSADTFAMQRTFVDLTGPWE